MDNCVDLSIVIPAYNEEKRIGTVLASVRDFVGRGLWPGRVETIVVSDGCTDGTEQVVREWQGLPGLRLVGYPDNRGKGYAVREGIMQSRGRIVAFMDADGSTPVTELLRLALPIQRNEADVVIGSRRVGGARIEERQPLHRRLLGHAFSLCNRLILDIPFHDTQCGFKLFRGDGARELFRNVQCPGFGFDLEVLVAARKRGLRIAEIGVAWRDTPGSKVSPVPDGWRMLRMAWQLRGRAAMPPSRPSAAVPKGEGTRHA
jgi:dolichyl-phosphate beta-glucosyltransferase